MRATRAPGVTVGRWSASGWSDVAERQARATPILQDATLPGRTALNHAASLSQPAALHQHRPALEPPVGDPPIEARAAIGPHAALHAMAEIEVLEAHVPI